MMKKWIVILLMVAVGSFVFQSTYAQGLTSADIYSSFKYRMKSDDLTFPDSVIYRITNFAAQMTCAHGWAYPKVDTLVLATGTEQYGLANVMLWVYRVGPLGEGERSWTSLDLSNFGKYYIKEATAPAYYDFVTLMENVTSTFGAGNDTSYIYVFPKPTSADNNDSIEVHYFAWADTIDANLRNLYHDAVVELSLMVGHIRNGRTDLMVRAWNNAGGEMSKLRNDWLGRIHNVEVVPKDIGGQ